MTLLRYLRRIINKARAILARPMCGNGTLSKDPASLLDNRRAKRDIVYMLTNRHLFEDKHPDNNLEA